METLPWTQASFDCVDLETSSFDRNLARICEWAVVPIKNGEVSHNNVYVEQLYPSSNFISARATNLHGLTMNDVRKCQKVVDFKDELWMVFGKIMIVHGASHEIHCFEKELPGFSLPIILDTQKWARILHPKEKYGLDALIARYNIHGRIKPHPQGRELRRHRAYYDACATALLFTEFARRHGPNLTLGEIFKFCRYR